MLTPTPATKQENVALIILRYVNFKIFKIGPLS